MLSANLLQFRLSGKQVLVLALNRPQAPLCPRVGTRGLAVWTWSLLRMDGIRVQQSSSQLHSHTATEFLRDSVWQEVILTDAQRYPGKFADEEAQMDINVCGPR